MIIDVKYNINDPVEYRKTKSSKIYATCPCCNGEKSITGQNNQRYFCPECNGVGYIDTGEFEVKEEINRGVISTAHVKYDSNMDDGRVKVYYTVSRNDTYVNQNDIIRVLEEWNYERGDI